MDEFNDDEFDEFGNFDREKLNKLFRERMGDDDFKKKFLGILGGYENRYEEIMKLMWGMNNNPFGLDATGLNVDGYNSYSGVTNDGKTNSVSIYTMSMSPEEFYNSENRNNMEDQELAPEIIIDLLQNKLDEAVSEENYEEASSLLDTINSLKGGVKTENKKK